MLAAESLAEMHHQHGEARRDASRLVILASRPSQRGAGHAERIRFTRAADPLAVIGQRDREARDVVKGMLDAEKPRRLRPRRGAHHVVKIGQKTPRIVDLAFGADFDAFREFTRETAVAIAMNPAARIRQFAAVFITHRLFQPH